MKGRILIILAMVLCLSANAQDSTKVNSCSFSLDAGLAFDNYGWLNGSDMSVSTEYAGLRISPDWLIARHWGIKLDVSAGWAFYSNVTGPWERPMHSITNIGLGLSPYYEFQVRRWFMDLGVVAGVRARLPYMNGEMSRYLMTLSVGVGAHFRFGYMITDHLGVYADVKAERTVYDILYEAYYSSKNTAAGVLGTSAGVVYRF